MSFLDELANEQEKHDESQSSPNNRNLWESCFKYFQHFTSILQKEEKTFNSEFSLTFLDLKSECLIKGPYEIKRTGNHGELQLELKFNTQLKQGIRVRRNDARSAEILKSKLSKDSSILSNVKKDNEGNIYVELNPMIPSFFRIILKNGQDFYVQYKNISNTSVRTKKLDVKNINEKYMDALAKYILGKNPELYTEKVSDQTITKIREKLELAKRIQEKKEADDKAKRIAEEKKREEQAKVKSKKSLFSGGFMSKFRHKPKNQTD